MKILYAITGHGFGHATRALLVAQALRGLLPRCEILISTSLSKKAIDRLSPAAAPAFGVRAASYEPGTAQSNCFEVDPRATRAMYRAYLDEHSRLLRRELQDMKAAGIEAVISDVAALPLAAAKEQGLPGVMISNFTWDWILEPILAGDADGEACLERIREDYRRADLFLRLPFHGRQSPIDAVEDAPLVGRRARLESTELRRRLGLDPSDHRPVVLMAVGGWAAEAWPPIVVPGCGQFRFLVVGDIPVRLPEAEVIAIPFDLLPGVSFADLVAACDLGLVKPGYGTCSEFVIHRRPMVAVERRGFREYEELLRGMDGLIRFQPLSLADFFRGAWAPALEAVAGAAAREAPMPPLPWPEDGAGAVARRVGEAFGLGPPEISPSP